MEIKLIITILLYFQMALISSQQNRQQRKKAADCENKICQVPTGDLLAGRRKFLYASSTCGSTDPERYCVIGLQQRPIIRHNRINVKQPKKVVDKRNADSKASPNCDICDSRFSFGYSKGLSNKSHRIEMVVSGDYNDTQYRWWQSKNNLDNVHVQFELENEFLLSHILMKFKTDKPATMLIEKSNDYGLTWKPISYYAQNCKDAYPDVNTFNRSHMTTLGVVSCKEVISQGDPQRDRVLVYRVIEPNMFNKIDLYSSDNLDVLKITNIRFNFTKLSRYGDQNIFPDDNEVYEKYYYAINQISIIGSCLCYGHANQCKVMDDSIDYDQEDKEKERITHATCECLHNTDGLNCERCLPLYNDKPWAAATINDPKICQKCECNDHAESCEFDEKEYNNTGRGGICKCLDHTQGKNCQECKIGFYHDVNVPFTKRDACKACDCNLSGSRSEFCNIGSDTSLKIGQCFCKKNVEGRRCDRCKLGFRNLNNTNPDGCEPCVCNVNGTIENEGCSESYGVCRCKPNVMGSKCEQCKPNHYDLDTSYEGCKLCDCSIEGSVSQQCNHITGQCPCRPYAKGRRCEEIEAGYYCPGLDHLKFDSVIRFNSEANLLDRKVHVKANGEITMVIEKTEISGFFNLLIRYHAQGDWKVKIKINSKIDEYSLGGETCDKYSFEISMNLQHSETYSITEEKFCFDKSQKYEVVLIFNPNNQQYRNQNYILFDSIILFPSLSRSKIEQISNNQVDLNYYEWCKNRFYSLDDDYQEKTCRHHICPITSHLFGLKPCECQLGSESDMCEQYAGRCKCRMNVEGRKCDSCVREYFGLSTTGCQSCACAQGALNRFCDVLTGQCKCDELSAGRTCDKCKMGYYGKTPECESCSCNSFSNNCNFDTGECLNCTGQTTGFKCDKCEIGYYGAPALGIHCRKCMCPGVNGVQHAETCTLDKDNSKAICQCKEGYIGDNCDRCDKFYYGNPLDKNIGCKRCDCNNNVGEWDLASCDAETGECLNCLFNTGGFNCEKCKYGFYGLAKQKACYECGCDPRGTIGNTNQNCNDISGECNCLPNVEGTFCDKPIKDFYWNPNKNGTLACDCDTSGTIEGTSMCDENTGICPCRVERGGRICNECADKKWGDPKNKSCEDCKCDGPGSNSSRCDKKTGKCICKSGIIGANCDRCAPGTKGKIPTCEPCGECFDNWFQILKDIKNKMDKLEQKVIENLANEGQSNLLDLEATFKNIESNMSEVKELLNSTNDERIKLMNQNIDDLNNKLKHSNETKAQYIEQIKTLDDFDIAKKDATNLKIEMQTLDDLAKILRESVKSGATASLKSIGNDSKSIENNLFDMNKMVNVDLKDLNKLLKEEKLNFSEKLFETLNKIVKEVLVNHNETLEQLKKANNKVCGGPTLLCTSKCGAIGCGRCGIEDINPKAPETETEFELETLNDEYYNIEIFCDQSLNALLKVITNLTNEFNQNYNTIESELKQMLETSQRVLDSLVVYNNNQISDKNRTSEEFNKLKNRSNEIENITIKIKNLKESFGELIIHIESIVDYFEMTEAPHSKYQFDEIMISIDILGADVLEKAEKIREETKDWKRDSEDVKKSVENLIIQQKNVLDRVAEKEAKLLSAKDLMNKADDNLNSVININKQSQQIITESENTFQNIEQNATHIHFLNEEFLSAVGSEQVFVPNFLDLPKKLEENIIEKNAKLQLINQDIIKLDKETKELYKRITENTVNNIENDRLKNSFKMLAELKKNVETNYKILEIRDMKLAKLKVSSKKDKIIYDVLMEKFTGLIQNAYNIKADLEKKKDYFAICQ